MENSNFGFDLVNAKTGAKIFGDSEREPEDEETALALAKFANEVFVLGATITRDSIAEQVPDVGRTKEWFGTFPIPESPFDETGLN